MSLSEQLSYRGPGGITRTVDALYTLQLSKVKDLEEWIDNLRRLLGRHIFETINRFGSYLQQY